MKLTQSYQTNRRKTYTIPMERQALSREVVEAEIPLQVSEDSALAAAGHEVVDLLSPKPMTFSNSSLEDAIPSKTSLTMIS